MAIRVDAYTALGMGSGDLVGSERIRDALEIDGRVVLSGVTWQDLTDGWPREIPELAVPADDVLVIVADDTPIVPVHSVWHRLRVEAGPYLMEGELPTQPGFDPGRSLTRPSGPFVLIRHVSLSLRERPDLGAVEVDHALVNRYTVDEAESDLELSFFFPGVIAHGPPPAPTAAAS
ncbi:MAG: hypothetical protein ACJ761_02595 [Chloroflexota bacterium]